MYLAALVGCLFGGGDDDAEVCDAGFGLAEDGNCYPLAGDDDDDDGPIKTDTETDADADSDSDADADADVDSDSDADADSDTDTDTYTGHSGHRQVDWTEGDVAAVGFEFDGILLPNGTFTWYDYGGYQVEPTLYLTFVTGDYFSAVSEQEEAERSCIAFGTWSPASPLAVRSPLPVVGAPRMHWSWEEPIHLDLSDCQSDMDAATFNLMLQAFDGTRFGMGLGAMTPSFLAEWGIYGFPQYVPHYETYGLVDYVAVTDESGTFVGRQWDVGFLYEWDPVTHELVDVGGYLVPIVVSAVPELAPLPEGYLRTSSFWYADLCVYLNLNGYVVDPDNSCIDLANL